MSSYLISVPGKSFLAGEYLVLKGGPGLVFASSPRFELQAQPGSGLVEGILPQSPAGKLISADFDFYKSWDLKFIDPHFGEGGWGASTAQFLSVFALKAGGADSLGISELLSSYWKYAWDGEGFRPSGADLIAQYKGGLSSFAKETNQIFEYSWNFNDIDFAIVPTGKKLPTHEHLKILADFDEGPLEAPMRVLLEGLKSGSSMEFVEGVRQYSEKLTGMNLVASHTSALMQQMKDQPGVLAVKGCGAMGADVIFVAFQSEYRERFSKYIGSAHLSRGLEVQREG
ncbi:MAG: hypothetical protein IPM97_07230 [Bdellovibrionaceae bacterium]|nr:hypothetical protein [Pseudobdellovibrionaceae bacterium]